MKPYITVCRVGEIVIPVLSVHATDQEAHDNAIRAVLKALTEQAPHLLSERFAVEVKPLSDAAVREWLGHIATHRPDLLPTPPKVKRGKG